MIPTFDEWHLKRYGLDFEARVQGWLYQNVMQQLTRDLRDYTTEMVRRAVS